MERERFELSCASALVFETRRYTNSTTAPRHSTVYFSGFGGSRTHKKYVLNVVPMPIRLRNQRCFRASTIRHFTIKSRVHFPFVLRKHSASRGVRFLIYGLKDRYTLRLCYRSMLYFKIFCPKNFIPVLTSHFVYPEKTSVYSYLINRD